MERELGRNVQTVSGFSCLGDSEDHDTRRVAHVHDLGCERVHAEMGKVIVVGTVALSTEAKAVTVST